MTTEDRIITLANEILEEARTSSDIAYRAEVLAALQNACDILAADRPGEMPRKVPPQGRGKPDESNL